MGYLLDKCTLRKLDENLLNSCDTFDCEDTDLNEFFAQDCCRYSVQLLGKSYCFTEDEDPKKKVCAFTVSNDSIKSQLLPRAQRDRVTKEIPRTKRVGNYPAVLIGRLGVSKDYAGQKIGPQLMDFIKSWFSEDLNKTGCRYIVVDSYNTEKARKYYEKCGFSYLFRSDDEEREYMKDHLPEGAELKTRLMHFDLILLR